MFQFASDILHLSDQASGYMKSRETCQGYPMALNILRAQAPQRLRCMTAWIWFPLWKLNANHFSAGQRSSEGDSPMEKGFFALLPLPLATLSVPCVELQSKDDWVVFTLVLL